MKLNPWNPESFLGMPAFPRLYMYYFYSDFLRLLGHTWMRPFILRMPSKLPITHLYSSPSSGIYYVLYRGHQITTWPRVILLYSNIYILESNYHIGWHNRFWYDVWPTSWILKCYWKKIDAQFSIFRDDILGFRRNLWLDMNDLRHLSTSVPDHIDPPGDQFLRASSE